MKLSKSQEKTLELMRRGYTATIYFDDPRCRLFAPGRHTLGSPRVNRHTLASLLRRNLIAIADKSENHVSYAFATEGKVPNG